MHTNTDQEQGPDISMLSAVLQRQWDHDKNAGLTATGRCGGNVINAQMTILMPGKHMFISGPEAVPVPSA